MNGSLHEPIETEAGTRSPRRQCTVEGCECKDVRIVLRRRVAFFADFARRRGQTATRVIAAEPGWAIPQAGLLR
jgi:hypothetical protein